MDTRIVVHLQDALDTGSTTCLVLTVDTDVVAIIIGNFHTLTANHATADVDCFWHRKELHIYISTLSAMLWEETDQLHFLYFTVSQAVTQLLLFGEGGKSAWAVWKAYVDVTCSWQDSPHAYK